MQKKTEIKLPQIKKTHKQSSVLLSKTISDNGGTQRLRPASSNKVEDLEKKLFNKLQAYEHPSRKRLTKKGSKLGKQTSFECGNAGEGVQGYQRMQKHLPELYSRLIQAKKGGFMSQNLISEIQLPSSQLPIPNPFKKTSEQMTKTQSKPELSDIAAPNKEEELYSQEEMDQIFKEYEQIEGLPNQTSNKEMKELNESLLNCQSSIDEIRRSMQGLIRQIGMQCINQFEKDQQLDFSQ